MLGDRIQVSWFKDLRKARQKHHFHDRRYGKWQPWVCFSCCHQFSSLSQNTKIMSLVCFVECFIECFYYWRLGVLSCRWYINVIVTLHSTGDWVISILRRQQGSPSLLLCIALWGRVSTKCFVTVLCWLLLVNITCLPCGEETSYVCCCCCCFCCCCCGILMFVVS